MRKSVVMSYLTMKGGVGKTTLAANVTRAMAELTPMRPAGAPTKYLLIDADAQCNLTQIFLTPAEIENRQGRNLYQAFDASHRLYGPSDLKTNVYQNRSNNCLVDLIPGSFETFAFVVATPTVQASASKVFSNFIKAARREYDYIVIDTNPSATFATLQALEVSEFLVAPITFDSFSLRGIDLILRTLRDRYRWLMNPMQVRIIPNRVKRTRDEAALRRQESDEQAVIDAFKNLEKSISLSRIHESNLLDNRLSRRGHGFAVDQRVFPFHRSALNKVAEDFRDVARSLNAALNEVFGDEAQNGITAVSPAQGTLEAFFDQAMGRH